MVELKWDSASFTAIRTTATSHDWARGDVPRVRTISSHGPDADQDQRQNPLDGNPHQLVTRPVYPATRYPDAAAAAWIARANRVRKSL
jgi:hypothetical protein